MPPGYNIQCQAGDLYTRQCFIGNPADGKKIIAYTSSGSPIGFDQITGKTYLVSLDATGQAYEPYGSAGVPYTAMGWGPLSSLLGNWMPSGGSSSQDFNRLMTLPGAQARVRAASTTVPWYYNVFGLKYNPRVVGQPPQMSQNNTGAVSNGWGNWFKELFSADEHGVSSHNEEMNTDIRESLWDKSDKRMLYGVIGAGLFLGTLSLTKIRGK